MQQQLYHYFSEPRARYGEGSQLPGEEVTHNPNMAAFDLDDGRAVQVLKDGILGNARIGATLNQ